MLFIEYLTDTIDYPTQDTIYDALEVADLEAFRETFVTLFASIAHNNYVKNNMAHYEGYYASLFYAYLAATGLNIIAEDVTNSGRIDLTILLNEKVYILEFKMGKEDALAQIKAKAYAQKYRSAEKEVYLIGINFDEKVKNIQGFAWEKVEG